MFTQFKLSYSSYFFANGSPNSFIEDSYVHNYIAPILQPIFTAEPLLHIQWANSYLNKKENKVMKEVKKDEVNKKTTGQVREKGKKPDFVANVKTMNSWISVTIGEFKSPKFSRCFESDLVKVGKEMRTMLNALICLECRILLLEVS
ncbi:hypothetical protein G6F57_008030 [Rhizopus arrhizus]|uniref:Uncharacterized protein n=1 Tax=Rhizopus oryzae TaxID=64495 RepID=A0A9P7BQY6_RHIOR|nr:hypothetical protein G6F30_008904 [Rhizopus arrhizus]KAG1392732.1 hypothetical protein G6F58_012452 [Rhizopus delemar]KAG0980448.1 hypothetical protein G6F29_007825 [Rhizopus arrhizus]KAG0991376.1 hypothetical protein G6F28_008653 [Rhizopus arrhizus]KAG1005357.1 hypothetical protein G6F27_009302 [Rhizopus arrhizus]